MKRFLSAGEGYAPFPTNINYWLPRYFPAWRARFLYIFVFFMCLQAVEAKGTDPASDMGRAVFATIQEIDSIQHNQLQDSLNVKKDTVHAIEEVQISTGYQRIPRERATGSFVFIDSAMLQRSVSTDIISRLKGVTPSLLFDERAGGDPKLIIRGQSTIFGNATPLIVVDNFPYEGDIHNINPNDVESVTILRDAAAASIWGIRAGNGVIVITTKQGKIGQPVRLSFNHNVTIGEKPDLFYEPRLSPGEQVDLEAMLFGLGHYNSVLQNSTTFPVVSPVAEILADPNLSESEKQLRLDDLRGNDIRRELLQHFYQPSIRQQHALRISGGGQAHRFYVSGGYDQARRDVVGNKDARYTLSSRLSFNPLLGLELESGLFLVHNAFNGGGGGQVISWLENTFSYQSLTDSEGRPLPITTGYRASFADRAEQEGRLNWRYYPLNEIDNMHLRNTSNNYRVTGKVGYKFGKGFHAETNYQFEKQLSLNEQLYEETSYFVRDQVNRYTSFVNGRATYALPLGAILRRGDQTLDVHNLRTQINYDYDVGPGRLLLLAGAEVREARSKSFNNGYFGYNVENGTSIPVNLSTQYTTYPSGSGRLSSLANMGINGHLERFRSFFANGSYQLLNRYVFTASARMDQTNLFGVKTNQRSIPLWSAGVKWDLSKEDFYTFRQIPSISMRATYGYNGNFDPTAKAYVTASYRTNLLSIREAALGALPNPELRGERTAVMNVGVDLEGIDKRFIIRFDYYDRRGRDLIGSAPIDPTVGKTTFRGNQANMTSRGIEMELQSTIRLGGIDWCSTLHVNTNIDKVTKYLTNHRNFFVDASLLGHNIAPVEGRPLFGIYSLPWGGLDPATGHPIGYLDGVESQNYQAISNSIVSALDLTYHGPARPRLFGAFRQDISYRNFSLSINITYKAGYFFRRSSIQYGHMLAATTIPHQDFALRWKQPGDEFRTQVASMIYPANGSRDNFYLNSSALIERGDHIRLQDLRFGYTHRRFQMFAYTNNLGILWRANSFGIDPDFNSNATLGNTTLPMPRTWALGFNYTL